MHNAREGLQQLAEHYGSLEKLAEELRQYQGFEGLNRGTVSRWLRASEDDIPSRAVLAVQLLLSNLPEQPEGEPSLMVKITKKVVLTKERQGEIALALVQSRMRHKEVPSLESVVKETGISPDELRAFGQILAREYIGTFLWKEE